MLIGNKGWVICEESQATYIASKGFRVIPVKLYQPVQRQGFTFIPVPASDGTGDDQVSWIIIKNGKKLALSITDGNPMMSNLWRQI